MQLGPDYCSRKEDDILAEVSLHIIQLAPVRQTCKELMNRSNLLEGVVAVIYSCQHSGPVDIRVALKFKLESIGARVCQRLGKDTTHIVFQRQHQGSDEDKQAEALALLDLYEKAGKVGTSMFLTLAYHTSSFIPQPHGG